MSIGRKIALGFAALILFALAGAAVSVGSGGRALTRLAPVDARYLASSQIASDIERELLNARIHFIYHVTVQKPGEKERGWSYFQQAQGHLAQLEQLVRSSSELAPLASRTDALHNDVGAYEPVLTEIIQSVDNHQNSTPDFNALRDRWASLGNRMVQTAGEVSSSSIDLAKVASQDTQATLSTSRVATLAGGTFSLLFTIGIAGVLIRQINRNLGQASSSIARSAQRITETAAAMAESAQSSSQRASDQAASVQETSAASQEISSMARGNLEHAQTAAQFSRDAVADSTEASAAVNQLSDAMTAIAKSANSISGVLRIIDDLAFQTNILALNAAVEAARAGEAGAGFAVVADEVRNLAQRSGDAAHDTAALVEQSMSSVSVGQERVKRMNDSLQRIIDRVRQLGVHVDEVATSSGEQTTGLSQISAAIARIEQAAQQSATAAAERAASSDELASEAAILKTTSVKLARLVRGNG